ncbi:PDZ and LIM domain protein Zasp isoform X1 [Bactrocera dorsalis]|uniref:PDZ and LIM domain protein Zasp isoform X1 n=1 Tax=Bactrocera dorsalis TaxID=27457 RepID=A0ABM3JHT6_BACDO|nr:PDZ and LIM domain protein Zasp isoform X1 [Bactrocera dorsalis]XP_049308798.1 PDZ and LIM domain protein Zasp isoform X1 [Bactrocera dorsalis]XP_049308799.1 PDZ and LIM domain protein Zasp isoform X1 [Bactrocera dorsalis]XP_049308800.1 PDZ and LIM domain protein Zasp isoform X1 [Bactrocera dorsalis]XP_049308801.1 PDZ and LIM domain protein Zasp isoform X1 [Bactrocera dorsalis]
MAQPQLLQIKLSRFDAQPWGFRLQGGVDFATPLVVQKVNGGSLAEKAGLIPGDAVLKINDVDVFNLRHKDAQDVVVRSGNNFVLTVQRGGSTWRPHVTPTGNIPQPQQNSPYLQTVTKTSLAHKQQESQHIGCGYNNAARPFANGGDGNVKSIVNKQYNTPVGIYSDESIAETLSAQAEVLAGGVLGVNFKKNEKEYQPDKSEVLKFLREEETGASTPEPPAPANFYWTQSHAIGGNERRTPLSHKHQQLIPEEQPKDDSTGTNLQENKLYASSAQRPSLAQPAKPSSSEPADPRVIIMPVCPALQGPEYKAEMEAAAAALQHDDGPRPLSASGHPACALCGVGIVGVFVRIKDKNLHVECFKCATCGTSLKNQGYYNYNNKLYCDIHAKLAALQNPPSGTDGYVPVPIKPNTKLSANTISSALNAHGFSEIPVANGGSVAPPTAPTAPSQDGIQRNNIDLPLPPPPSPTSLQQLGVDNGSEISQELNRLSSLSSTSNSLSASSPGHMSQIEVTMAGTVDEMSSGYVSTSSLNSHQASSSPSSTCGIKTNNNAVTLIAALPPPPPPLPPCSQLRQQNEYDMNSQNQFDSGVGGDGLGGISHDSSVGHSSDGKHSLSGGDYNKFLKEYSNKLLTLTKQNNNNTLSNTNILNDDLTPNDNPNSYKTNNLINSYHSPSKKTTQTPVQAATHSLQTCGSTTIDSTKTRPTQHSAVVALSPTFANQLKFNSCQQVAKPTATLDPPPPATPDSLSTTQASTAISSTIANSTLLNTTNNINSSNNNKESEQLEGATQSIHGKSTNFSSGMLANPSSALDTASNDQPFGEYVTLTGSVIRSVVPPGKGVNINYKINQGYARPFGAAPAVAPKSPVAYPPQRPAVNPYATLPRTNIGQQDSDASLQPQYAEGFNSTAAPAGADYFEEDHELSEVNRQNRSNFSWPPPKEDSPIVPTAAPLYIPPPETQHVFAKAANVSHSQKEDEVVKKPYLNADEIKDNEHEQNIKQYLRSNRQSKSAPHLTIDLQPPEIESSSESFTSTSTTTTTTSEEYQRMYAAQVQAYQMQQIYEQQSGSELDYHMDMEVATMQQHPQDSSCISSSEYICGRRSAQECVESLVAPLNTNKLIDMVREVTPSPVPPPNIQGNRHVVFIDEPETKEIPSYSDEEYKSQTLAKSGTVSSNSTVPSDSVEGSETFVKIEHAEVQESQRIFQPTSEIKIEIAPVRQIPPSKIPNPVPKEWINPMVRVLTTAPDVPFHLVECPCPKPCDVDSFEPLQQDQTPQETVKTQDAKEKVCAEKTLLIEETPPKGSWLANAITTAPEWEVRFEPPPSQIIPLPEETKPYMPPPIDMKPYMREDYRPKSPFLSALTTAPERPFEGHFERDVPIHLLDLPTPKEHLTLSDALCTAPERAYTPLNPENATNVFEEQEIEKKKKKQEFQVLNREEELGIKALDSESIEYYTTQRRDFSQHRKSSAFAAMQAFQPTQEPLISNTPRQSIASYTKDVFDPDYEGYYKAKERNKKRIDYYHKKEEELQQQHIEPIKNQKISETNTCQMSSLNSYTKRNSSSESSSAVQAMSNTTSTSTYDSNSTHASRSSYQNNTRSVKSDVKVDLHEVIEETTEELEHSEVLFPPPSPLSHLHGKSASSGLHKADTIPKYQRNWTVLPTQSPARTPEPPELRENIPLAFVDAPVTSSSSNPVHKPVAQSCTTVSQQYQQQHEKISSANRGSIKSTSSKSSSQEQSKLLMQNKKPIVPIIIEEKIAPQVTMAFQSLDEHLQTDESQTLSRPYTPSISSKPVPVIPYYQTPEALCFDECPATHARNYDRRSASPFPDRARSPAPGPPPNPLAAIRSPKSIDNKLSSLSPRVLQAGSITTGQSYLGAQQQLQQQQQQTQILSHYEQAISTGSQSCINKPDTIKTCEIGDYKVQSTEKEVQKVHQNQSKLDSQTKIQLGDSQIESRRRVTEEYEHTQSARSVEIRTDSKTIKSSPASERRQSYGKTGYVANQARRLSGLEQEITNLTSQSQAISARAATLTETSFPQIKSPEPSSKFPTKPVLPPHDEPQRPNYLFSATPYNKMVGPPPGFNEQQQQLSSAYGSSVVSQQQQSLSTYSSSNFTSSTSKTSSLSSQANATNVGSLTKASITNNNIAGAASARTTGASAVCPVTGTFCRPGHTCCRQQQLQAQSSATDVVNYNQNNNLTYRTNASTGLTDIKTNAQATAIATANAANAIDLGASQAPHTATAAAATATATTSFPPPNTVDKNKSNAGLDGLTGVGGKGAFGATSAPKRGRGIFNKAVGPGVRVPLCSSCNIQIRGPFITALGRIWCPEHFICVNANCRRPLQDIGFVEEKGDLYCEYCFEKYLAPTCSKCGSKIKGDCLNAIGKQFHPECFTCGHCGKLFGNTPFFLEDGNAYCEADWNELFTTKCFACGFPVEAGDRWVEALNHNYHSQCFNCTYCKQNLEGQSFYNKGGRPFCKNHAR